MNRRDSTENSYFYFVRKKEENMIKFFQDITIAFIHHVFILPPVNMRVAGSNCGNGLYIQLHTHLKKCRFSILNVILLPVYF